MPSMKSVSLVIFVYLLLSPKYKFFYKQEKSSFVKSMGDIQPTKRREHGLRKIFRFKILSYCLEMTLWNGVEEGLIYIRFSSSFTE